MDNYTTEVRLFMDVSMYEYVDSDSMYVPGNHGWDMHVGAIILVYYQLIVD